MSIRFSASANGTRNTGQGGGQYLVYANAFSPADGRPASERTMDRPAASTADNYHIDGITDFRPWDLRQWGSEGAAIESANGYRYMWPLSCDHSGNGGGTEGGWGPDGWDVYAGFSNDPHVFPEASTLRSIIPNLNTIPGETGTFQGFDCWPVYNPDDATDPFYMYVEGGRQGGAFVNSLPMVLYKNSDFDSEFTPVSISHATTAGGGIPGNTAYQRVYRQGTGDWVSHGVGNINGTTYQTMSRWTSTDGVTFTKTHGSLSQINSDGTYTDGNNNNGWIASFNTMGERFQIGSDWYLPCKEDRRGRGWDSGQTYSTNEQVNVDQVTYKSLVNSNLNNNPVSSPSQWQSLGYLGQYITLVPFDPSTGDLNMTGSPPMIRISDMYKGLYPESSYLQYITNYVEDGVCTFYAVHGFFGDTGLVSSALPEDGGGLNEQYIDVYAYVFDATAAQASAPFNVRASCSAGVVTLTWADLPAGRSYRIKRGTDGVTFGTTVSSSVTAATITDSPTVGSVYYYQVTSLHGGVEQAARVVSTYVS